MPAAQGDDARSASRYATPFRSSANPRLAVIFHLAKYERERSTAPFSLAQGKFCWIEPGLIEAFGNKRLRDLASWPLEGRANENATTKALYDPI